MVQKYTLHYHQSTSGKLSIVTISWLSRYPQQLSFLLLSCNSHSFDLPLGVHCALTFTIPRSLRPPLQLTETLIGILPQDCQNSPRNSSWKDTGWLLSLSFYERLLRDGAGAGTLPRGVLPRMAYTERLRQKAVTFSGFECMKGYGFY